MRLLVAAVALTLAVGPAVAREGDAADVAALRRVFAGKSSPADRLAAARRLVLVDSKDGAELACRALAQCLDHIDALSAERGRVRDEIARRQGAEALREIPYYPEDVRAAVTGLRAREVELRSADAVERDILAALRRGLAAHTTPGAVEYLAGPALRSHASEGVRALVAEVLGERADAAFAKPLAAAATADRSERVREAALAALARAAPAAPESMAAFAAAAKDGAWTVRIAAARAASCSGLPAAVDLMIEILPREEGRRRRDVAGLLAAMTGERLGAEPEAWRSWWASRRSDYEGGAERLRRGPFPPGAGAGGAAAPTHYYGIETWSQRILFVLDISGSMAEPGGRDAAVPRIEEAKRELVNALRSIDPAGGFGVYVFHDAVRKWKPGLVPAAAAAKEEASAWVRALHPSEWTNTFAALEEAFRVSAAAGLDPRYGGADTIFLLTDGSPTNPEGKTRGADGVDEADRVLAAVRLWNAGKRVELHCIGVGSEVNRTFLSRLAEENGGRFVQVR